MSGRADAGTRLERTLTAHAAASMVTLNMCSARATHWASATFVGARHILEIGLAGPTARAWLDGLAEADLPVRGHLVADVVVIDQRHDTTGTVATIEVLTVEDCG